MRLAFLGSPETAVVTLDALIDADHEIVIAVTQPDRKRGRGGALSPTPVKEFALARGIPVSHAAEDVISTRAELGVVVAFGKLIRPPVLEAVPMVNVHFSLLPRWRGAAPIERAILEGDTETGVCLMALDEGLDTGPIYACESTAIGSGETAGELRRRLAQLGTRLLVDRLASGLGEPQPQVGEATYAQKIDPGELRIAWSRPATEVHRVVRLGRAWTTFRGKRLQVLAARPVAGGPDIGAIDGLVVGCGDGTGLELHLVQPEGRRPMPAEAWSHGVRPEASERLGESPVA
jgi:methionyl-tRNA formyltransferase